MTEIQVVIDGGRDDRLDYTEAEALADLLSRTTEQVVSQHQALYSALQGFDDVTTEVCLAGLRVGDHVLPVQLITVTETEDGTETSWPLAILIEPWQAPHIIPPMEYAERIDMMGYAPTADSHWFGAGVDDGQKEGSGEDD